MKRFFILSTLAALLLGSTTQAQTSVRNVAKNLSTQELTEGFKSGAQTIEVTSTGTLKWNTGATLTNASAFRTSAGLVIGTHVMGYSSALAAIAGGTWTGATSITTLGTITSGTWTGTAVAVANGGTGATTASDARTNLGLAIGTNVQAYSANLDTFAGIAPAANVQSLLGAADYASIKTLLGLGAAADLATSTGGNGITDDGKAVIFAADGSLTGAAKLRAQSAGAYYTDYKDASIVYDDATHTLTVVPPSLTGNVLLTWPAASGALARVEDITATIAATSISIAGTATAINGSISRDTILGLSSTGVVKRTGANVLAVESTLSVVSGGTGQSSYTDGQLLIGNTATGLLSKATLTAGTNITITNGNGTITIAASGGGTAANPTASLGLTAVNGSATSYMRSDAAPALDQSIAPTWTGQHTFAAGTITTSKPLTLTQTWNASGVNFTALLLNITNTASNSSSLLVDVQEGGTSKFKIAKTTGHVTAAGGIFAGGSFDISSTWGVNSATGNQTMYSAATFGWSAGTGGWSASADTMLARLSAGQMIMRNSTTAQTFLVANTYTSTTSYEAAGTWWSSNVAYIGSQKGSGGGSARDVSFVRDSTVKETLGANTNDDAQPRKLYSCTYTGRPNAATVGAGAVVYMTNCNCTVAGTNVTATGTGTCVAISDGTNWVALFVLAAGA